MKTTKTTRKPLQLKTETLARLNQDALKEVRGGLAVEVGPTAQDHSCNPACYALTLQ